MGNLDIIDQFLATFIHYIDAGFGLLGGDVRFLSRTLIALDITLAGLFWSLGGEDNVIGRLVRKILYIGVFAYILNNFSALSMIIFRSFAQAGLTAEGKTIEPDDLLKPGHLADIGFSSAWPLLHQVDQYLGFTSFFENFPTIAVLLIAWLIVILAFFILAVQLFVCVIEFKLTSLAGFILVPFALWNRTSFLAERVLGNVVSSGIKVMILAIIVGIGGGYFVQFEGALAGQQANLSQAMSLVLASLALFGLGIYAPALASGLIAGGPQLEAGAVLGTAFGAGSAMALGGAGALGAAREISGGLGSLRAATAMGPAGSSATLVPNGVGGTSAGGSVNPAGGAARGGMGSGSGIDDHGVSKAGIRTAPDAFNAQSSSGSGVVADADASQPIPDWARSMRTRATLRHHSQAAMHAIQQGDRGSHGAIPDIKQRED